MRLAPLIALTASLAGCSLARGVLAPGAFADATPDEDAWTDLDADVDGSSDDTGASDAGPCAQRCDGNTAVTCNLDHEVRTPCNGMVCDPSGASPTCLPRICTPDSASCSPDGTTSTTCSHAGTVSTTTPCDRGCSSGACRPLAACTEPVVGTIAMSGTLQVDLCGMGNGHTDSGTHGDCPTTVANGEDAMYRLDLDRTLRVMITETDVTVGHHVNPIVYLRSACATRSSEIDCNDNGAATTAMLDVVLQAGEYFVIFDSFDDATHVCGMISITTSFSPP